MNNHSKIPPETSDEILGVESYVQRALLRVPPPPAFREHLRDGLMLAAQHQQTHHALGYARPRRNNLAWLWMTVAMTIGITLGFIVMRQRVR